MVQLVLNNFMTKNKTSKRYNSVSTNKGFTMVEIIIGSAIISVAILALMLSAQKSIQLSDRALKQAQASTLLEEGAEAVKSIRDNNWDDISSLAIGTNYYLYFNTTTNSWSLSTDDHTPLSSIPTYPIDGTFNRIVTVSSVNRDSNDDIATTGTLDQGTKKITVTVSWKGSQKIVSEDLDFYITDLFN